MEYKNCTQEFSRGYPYKGTQYNKLIGTKSSVTTPSTIIFSNGELDGPIELDEHGAILSDRGLKPEDIIKVVQHANPKEYLENNSDLAESVRHILMSPDANS